MEWRYVGTVFCVLATCVVNARTASAQQGAVRDDEEAKVKARALADHGLEMSIAGDHAKALDAFIEAERYYRAPTISLMVARSYVSLGRLLEARLTYEQIISESIDESAPQPFRQAQEAATVELESVNRRIPTIQVVVVGIPYSEVSLQIDGAAVRPDESPIPKNPGRVMVVARAAGRPPIERVIVLREGESRRIELNLLPPPRMAPAVVYPATQGSSHLPVTIAFGLAGLGLGVGAVVGAIAKVQVDDIKSRCNEDGHCPIEDQSKADRAQSMITVSTIGFVGGGVAACAGTVLLLLGDRVGTRSARESFPINVSWGPGSVHLVGRF